MAQAARGNHSRRRRPTLAVALTAVVLLAGACGDDTDGTPTANTDNITVHPFEDVQASDMTFEADPSDPTRAIFRVTTTEPMICAIVWGPDASYGQFNNSLAMNLSASSVRTDPGRRVSAT